MTDPAPTPATQEEVHAFIADLGDFLARSDPGWAAEAARAIEQYHAARNQEETTVPPADTLTQIPLPDELATFLRPIPFAVMNHATTDGAVLIVKAPTAEIDNVRGRVPIRITWELHRAPWAPVVRLVLKVYDNLDNPLMLETFFNVADPEQLANLRNLIATEQVRVLFYDETVTHRLSKIVTQSDDPPRDDFVPQALRILAAIAPEVFNFERAKALVMRHGARHE